MINYTWTMGAKTKKCPFSASMSKIANNHGNLFIFSSFISKDISTELAFRLGEITPTHSIFVFLHMIFKQCDRVERKWVNICIVKTVLKIFGWLVGDFVQKEINNQLFLHEENYSIEFVHSSSMCTHSHILIVQWLLSWFFFQFLFCSGELIDESCKKNEKEPTNTRSFFL